METISKETFWLQLLENPSLYGTITTEDNVFNYRSDCVWQVMNDTFIANGNDFETTKWEEMLGITTDETSLNARKANILNFITENVPITVKILEQFIKGITNNDYVFEYDDKTQNLFISLYCDYENNSNIPSLISRVIPSSVDVELEFSIPSDYISAEWLGTDTGQAYITVPLGAKAGQSIRLETEHWSDVPKRVGEGYFHNDLQKLMIGQWNGSFLVVYPGYDAFGQFTVKTWVKHMADCTPTKKIIYSLDSQKEYSINANFAVPTYTLFNNLNNSSVWTGKKRTWKAWLDGELLFNLAPAISPDGVACMFNKISKEAYYNIGEEDFIVGMNLKQALKLSQLPNTGGELTVSLPWEAQFISSGIPNTLQVCADNGWTIKVQYRDGAESERYSRYAECTTVDDMQAVNADYKNDLTADDLWVYPLPKLKNGYLAFNTFQKCKGWQVDLPALENGSFMLVRYGGEVFDRQLPQLTNGASMFRNMAGNKVFRSALPELTDGTNMFRGIDIYGVVYLIFESALPKLSKGDGMFDLCALDKQSVLNICNSLPTWTSGTHNITLGIHVDYETDADIATAVSEAEAKGWAVTVQWNGTATAQAASTWGLRRPSIYAKVSEYDGERYLSWGHYVTNWEENGYQEFSSVEEAKEYFNTED